MKIKDENHSDTWWGYARISTDKQSLQNQKLQIHDYVNSRKKNVDRIVTATVSSRKKANKRELDCILQGAASGEVTNLVFAELSRLGRSIGEVCRLVDKLVDECGVTLHFIKESMILTKGERDLSSKVLLSTFSLLAEIERDLISERTKAGLAAVRAKGVKLGRPAGKSKLDQYEDQIREWLDFGVSQRAIAPKVSCSEAHLSNWLKRKRKLWGRKQGSKLLKIAEF